MAKEVLSMIYRFDADAYCDKEKEKIVLTNGSKMFFVGGEE